MSVVIFDLRNATRIRVDNVAQIETFQAKMSGRLVNVWGLLLEDGRSRVFPQRHYQIERIEK